MTDKSSGFTVTNTMILIFFYNSQTVSFK